MKDQATQRLFTLADRAFWLIWLGFPVLVWVLVNGVLTSREQLAKVAPGSADCAAALPQVVDFSGAGQVIFWSLVAAELAVYVVLLALAHRVIHRCATGQVFVAPMIRTLRAIGIIIAVFPVADLVLVNLSMAAYVATGDLPVFVPTYALDLPVIGVGVLMVVMAAAMRMAIRLHQDAELTICEGGGHDPCQS